MPSFFRKFALAGLVLLGSAAALAQTPHPVAPATPAPAALAPATGAVKKLLLWKAVSGSNVEYFLGSIHVGTPDMYPLPKVVNDAFDRSKVLVEEIDLGKTDQAAIAQYIRANGLYTNGDTIWNHLGKPEADKVKKYLAKYGLPDQFIGMFKPWLASMMASLAPLLKEGLNSKLGIDNHFYELAQKDHKTFVEAESADYQLKLLASLSDAEGLAYLVFVVDQDAKSQQDSDKLEKLWRAGDADGLDVALNDVPKELAPMMEKILYSRNPHMADVAEKYLKGGGPCFFVVGAGHLVGNRGVIAILKQRGYQIIQLSAG